jgi:hypothetical protein
MSPFEENFSTAVLVILFCTHAYFQVAIIDRALLRGWPEARPAFTCFTVFGAIVCAVGCSLIIHHEREREPLRWEAMVWGVKVRVWR